MKTLLSLGARRFEIEIGPGVSRLVANRVPRALVLALLQRIAAEPQNILQLRSVLARVNPDAAIHRLDDVIVVEHLTTLVLMGRAALCEGLATKYLAGLDGVVDVEEPLAREPARAPSPPRTWIEIQLIGEDDRPIPGEGYRIELSDGSVLEGRLDAQGLARIEGIDPGTCVVTFPAFDEEAWVRA